ncbi:MAG: biotin--[acetyl-CoA-carboxylase] ligase [Verrucomicrobiota bacterium]
MKSNHWTLDRDAIIGLLGKDKVIGREIIVMEEVGSTNDEAKRLGDEGGEEGLVVFAEMQTSGRGRGGSEWVSCAGEGLMFSVLLRPSGSAASWLWLSHAAGVAVCRGIRAACGVEVLLKWPNDVYSADGKKVCGILVENQGDYVVVGMGINVLAKRFGGELADTAGSVAMLGGRGASREEVAGRVLNAFDALYRVGQRDRGPVIAEAEALSGLMGREIEFRRGIEGRERGRFLGLGRGGEMRVRLGDGTETMVVQADEVRVCGSLGGG